MFFISAVCQSISKPFYWLSVQSAVRTFSACNSITSPVALHSNLTAKNSSQLLSPTSLLAPCTPLLIPSAGMKQKGKLRKRCKHCYFIMIDERLHVWCDVHARHKQMQMIPRAKTVIVTTHATQGRLRPW